jgi:peptidyl-prolyl cis-trans isomerase B (cyclophilin B)
LASLSMVKLTTNFGDITLELNADKAPITAANFLQYVESGFYDGVIFHRVIDGFMIQGGGFDAKMKQKKTKDEIKNEAENGLGNDKYTVAMARTSIPDSASSQFFINLTDNDFLNHTAKTSSGWGYCVFGKVIEGMDVVDKIAGVKTGSNAGHRDVPAELVTIKKASVIK